MQKIIKKMIELLGIKSLIITDIDYDKDAESIGDINVSKTTNATIKDFYRIDNPNSDPKVEDLYAWKDSKQNIICGGLIYTCFQSDKDGYSRTLEEAMLSQFYKIDVTKSFTKKEWMEKRSEAQLNYVIPAKNVKDDDPIRLRDILKSTAGSKTSFMYSVIMQNHTEKTEPDYIQGGLKWLME